MNSFLLWNLIHFQKMMEGFLRTDLLCCLYGFKGKFGFKFFIGDPNFNEDSNKDNYSVELRAQILYTCAVHNGLFSMKSLFVVLICLDVEIFCSFWISLYKLKTIVSSREVLRFICSWYLFCLLWLTLCSQNAIQLEAKEKREKEMRNQLVEEAEEYKRAFYEKRKLNIETNKTSNREREKVWFLEYLVIQICMLIFPCLTLHIWFVSGTVVLG